MVLLKGPQLDAFTLEPNTIAAQMKQKIPVMINPKAAAKSEKIRGHLKHAFTSAAAMPMS